ncbi:MAG: DUF542 domain-containing protein [bacterium]|nr:DUF542 domain-containing protein [bacterium]
MPKITKEMIINEVIKQYPQTIAIFNQFKVDSCCGGGQSIAKTATADGVDIAALLTALNAAVDNNLK